MNPELIELLEVIATSLERLANGIDKLVDMAEREVEE